jgi:DNA polymerase-1
MVDLSQPVGTPAAPSPAAAASAAPPVATPSAMTPIPSGAPQLLLTLEALRAWLAEAATAKRLAVVPVPWSDGHKPPVPRLASLCGLALYAPTAGAVYIPFGHRYLGAPAQLTAEAALGEVAPLLRDPALPKVVFGAKDTFLALETGGLRLLGVDSDPALASYLMNAAEDHRLPALIARYLPEGYPLPTSREQLTQSGKHGIPFDQVDIAAAAGYAGSEAQAIAALSEVLKLRLDAAGQALLDKLELPLASVLSTIERHGVLLDVGVLERLSRDAELRLRTLEGEIEALGGVRINLNSPKQLAELLFGKLGLPAVKKTRGKTGMSVDAEVLEALAAEHPSAHTLVRAIIEHRSLSKLKSTYMDQFPLLRDPGSGRLHTSFQQVVAATGRLSSTEPNLQNIPIRSELGQEIRRAFIAPPGATLIAADYSQIELRVLAHLSGDELLCESFRNGEDVHVRTAIAMFGPEEGRTADKRRAAKMINYGIVYGLTDFGLASRLGIARGVAKEYIREYFARYRGVRDFMEELVVRARSEGGARTLLGRFRPLPDLSNKNFALRGYAERMAKNTPIQGTAADILKQAMIDVQAQLGAHEPTTRMLLTVHDELVLEAPSERSEAVGTLVKTTMEKAAVLSVPLQVDVGTGHSWADC